jgi:hypothetical protein
MLVMVQMSATQSLNMVMLGGDGPLGGGALWRILCH